MIDRCILFIIGRKLTGRVEEGPEILVCTAWSRRIMLDICITDGVEQVPARPNTSTPNGILNPTASSSAHKDFRTLLNPSCEFPSDDKEDTSVNHNALALYTSNSAWRFEVIVTKLGRARGNLKAETPLIKRWRPKLFCNYQFQIVLQITISLF